MSSQQTIQIPVGKLSPRMCAVLRIVTADQFLSDAVFQFVNINKSLIDWHQILKIDFGPGYLGAIQLAHAIWTDQVQPDTNPFKSVLSLSPDLKKACVKALALRWEV